ncbi:hypothetical protein J5N97_029167 [Dioscorea zingiberensis]|uniref:glutathione transferase n=1 Tax=Dioscorea zingiberensis TaxID=325984 RepID=A0A9D5C0D1_9LILI|nr:hypothetical protein J5N97_029167 [Dioscorea zingiberensis]
MEGVVKVYYSKPMLPDVSRVLACLYEKEIKFNLIDMHEGHQMSPGFLNLQASTRAPVPGFEDSSTILFESRAICRYVAEKYAKQNNKYLLGRDLLERASIEQWLKSEELSFDPPSSTLVFHLAFVPLNGACEPEKSLLEQNEKKLAKVLDVYEQRLGDSRFLAGNEFTLADLFHLPNSHYLANSEEWRHLFESRKNVRRWWKKISNRNSWRKVVEILKQEDALKKKQKEIKSLENQQTPVIRLSHLHRDSTSDQPTTTVTITKVDTEAPAAQSEKILIDQPAISTSPKAHEPVQNGQEVQSNIPSPQPATSVESTPPEKSPIEATQLAEKSPTESTTQEKTSTEATQLAEKSPTESTTQQKTSTEATQLAEKSPPESTTQHTQQKTSTEATQIAEKSSTGRSNKQSARASTTNSNTQVDQVVAQRTTETAKEITPSESQTKSTPDPSKSNQTPNATEPAPKPEEQHAKSSDEQPKKGSASPEKHVP